MLKSKNINASQCSDANNSVHHFTRRIQNLTTPYFTETAGKKVFGDEDPVGKTFRFNGQFNIIVGGVVMDLSSNTRLPLRMLLSFVDHSVLSGWIRLIGACVYRIRRWCYACNCRNYTSNHNETSALFVLSVMTSVLARAHWLTDFIVALAGPAPAPNSRRAQWRFDGDTIVAGTRWLSWITQADGMTAIFAYWCTVALNQ